MKLSQLKKILLRVLSIGKVDLISSKDRTIASCQKWKFRIASAKEDVSERSEIGRQASTLCHKVLGRCSCTLIKKWVNPNPFKNENILQTILNICHKYINLYTLKHSNHLNVCISFLKIKYSK